MLKKKEKFPKDDYDFELPKFNTKEEFEEWLDSLETYDAEVDERLKEQEMISMQISKFMIDGYNYLAKEDGLKDGLTLMYGVEPVFKREFTGKFLICQRTEGYQAEVEKMYGISG